MVQSKKFSEMLKEAVNKYHNNLITTAQVIEELIQIAQQMKEADHNAQASGLTEDEIAFYDALASNNSAMQILWDKQLREIAQILTKRVRENTSIDWQIKETAQAKLRVIVKRLLNQYGYPPDQALITTELILAQTKLLADHWSAI